MTSTLLITVRLHEPRYHGRPEWPPSPGRLFQALLAGAGHRVAAPEVAEALRWLERLPPPTIAAPRRVEGQTVTCFVPNNDLDAKGGDPDNLPGLRTQKVVQPQHLAHGELVYAWTLEGTAPEETAQICSLAEGLYQLGRGVDMASASAEVLPAPTASERLSAFDGTLHHPGIASAGDLLLCPRAGTLDSLNARYADFQERFDVTGEGRSQTMLFRQPRRAFMREVGYGAGQHRWVFEIRSREDIGKYAPDGLTRAHRCVVTWRDAATARLVESGLDLQAVHGVVVGRRPDEPLVVPTAHRLRILPLPSIGHLHADPGIRRLLVEIPDGGPIPPEDLRWAFAGLMAGEAILVPATDDTMVPHYSRPSRRWSSITPVALPSAHRSSPAGSSDPGSAVQRAATEDRARAAVYDALRHAGINARPARVELQQEPWSKGGECAARFAEERRFVPERLWHVRITFDRPIPGPLAIGDGRFLGLGVLAPDLAAPTCFAFQITAGLDPQADARDIAHHLRRAVMARAQQVWGHERLPEALTGHQPDGTPAQDVAHARFLVDSSRGVLFVIVPRRYRRLDRALDGFTDLRAGAAGWLTLQPFLPDTDSDPCLRPAMTWTTLTPYLVERHIRAASTEDAVEHDVREACRREGLPPPEHVVLRGIRSVPGLGVTAAVDLTFAVAVPGPLALGRDRHHGGGFFRARSTT